MQWRFHELQGPKVTSRRDAKCKQIDDWWQAFAAKADDLGKLFRGESNWDLPAWMQENLHAVDPNLMWEFGPAVKGSGHRLVITPESSRELRPLTDTVVERAPALPGWEFYRYRQPDSVETASHMVEMRAGGDLEDTFVRIADGENHRIDVTFGSPSTESEDDEAARNRAFVAIETLLGEELLDKWIGVIDAVPVDAPKKRGLLRKRTAAPEGFLPLAGLRPAVEEMIARRRRSLPKKPHYEWVADVDWTLFELQPKEAPDYHGQTDLFVAKTGNEAIWRATHGGGSFYEERFSACGETLCYVKVDETDVLQEHRFNHKQEIEDVLDAVLRPAGIGCHIGGGTGQRYSYIDLALTDAEWGCKLARDRLREHQVPKRSWIQFHNADLCGEWIGIYEDTPPPPE